jgi:hypothetical protein
MKAASILLGTVALVIGASANALTVKEFKILRNDARVTNYVYGVGNGMVWANTELIARHGQPLFCAPGTLVLNEENYLALLDSEIQSEKPKVKDDSPVEPVLLAALEKTFVCK